MIYPYDDEEELQARGPGRLITPGSRQSSNVSDVLMLDDPDTMPDKPDILTEEERKRLVLNLPEPQDYTDIYDYEKEKKIQEEDLEPIDKETKELFDSIKTGDTSKVDKIRKLLPKKDQKQYKANPFERVASAENKKKEVQKIIESYDPFEQVARSFKKPEPIVNESFQKLVDKSQEIAPKGKTIKAEGPTITKRNIDGTKEQETLGSTEIGRALLEGFNHSVSGIAGKLILGWQHKIPKEQRNFYEKAAALAAELIGDIPSYSVGGAIGGMLGGIAGTAIGASIGSIIPGAGTTAGAATGGLYGTAAGSAAGAMSLTSLLKGAYQEYYEYVENGGEATLGNYLKAATSPKVLKESGISGLVGSLFGPISTAMRPLLPGLQRIPHMGKILATKPGAYVAEKALEGGIITGSEVVVRRELPTLEQFVSNIGASVGMDLGHGVTRAMRGYGERPLIQPKMTEAELNVGMKQRQETIDKWSKRLPSKVIDTIEKTGLAFEKPEVFKERVKKIEEKAKWEERYQDFVSAKQKSEGQIEAEWHKKAKDFEKDIGRKFSEKEYEDLMYYMQGTRNPNIKGDTFDKIAERVPEKAKELAEKEIRPYFKKVLEAWNAHPETKNINPRDVLMDTYFPGIYENATPERMQKLHKIIESQYRDATPFGSRKEYLNFAEAADQAGLIPKYKNPIELAMHYGQTMNKLLHNAEYKAKLFDYQEKSGDTIIAIKEKNPAEYAKAKAEGYVPFQDPFLREYKKGEKWRKSGDSALVKPEVSDALKGVFSKKAMESSAFWNSADKLKNNINAARTMWSMFHAVPIMESSVGMRGFKALSSAKGRELRADPEYITKAKERGLVVSGPKEMEFARKKGNTLFMKGVDFLERNDPTRALKLMKKATNYIFDDLIPNQKILAYDMLTKEQALKFEQKNGKKLSPQETKIMERKIAEIVNNTFGGQNWERSVYFRDPRALKALHRSFAFGDWSTSAVKQFWSSFKPGMEGSIARKYMAGFVLRNGAAAGLVRAMLGGLYQSDEKNKSIKGIRWSPSKALKSIEDVRVERNAYETMKDFFGWTYPDLPINIPGIGITNLGRDEKGARLKGHLGKQGLENIGWLKDPLGTFISKANPVFTQAFKQAVGGLPKGGSLWEEKGGFYRGRKGAWEGKPFLSPEGLALRAQSIAEEFVPFSLRNGVQKLIPSILGSVPLGKQYTPYQAEDDIERAYLDPNKKRGKVREEAVRAILEDNHYSEEKINGAFSRVKGQLIRDRYDKKIERILKLKNDTLKEFNLGKMQQEMMKDPIGITDRQVQARIDSIQKKLENEGVLEKRDVVYREYKQGLVDAIKTNDPLKVEKVKRQIHDRGVHFSDRQIENKLKKLGGEALLKEIRKLKKREKDSANKIAKRKPKASS